MEEGVEGGVWSVVKGKWEWEKRERERGGNARK